MVPYNILDKHGKYDIVPSKTLQKFVDVIKKQCPEDNSLLKKTFSTEDTKL